MSLPKSVKGDGSIHHAMHVSYNEGIRKENPHDSKSVKAEMTVARVLSMISRMVDDWYEKSENTAYDKGYVQALKDVRKAINANHYQD